MKIGNAIKQCRTRAVFTQSELAKKAKVSQGYIANVERKNLMPTQKVLKRICDALGVPAVILIALATEYKDIKKPKKKLYNILSPVLTVLVDEALNEIYGKPNHHQ